MKHIVPLSIGMLLALVIAMIPLHTLASGTAYKQPIRTDGSGNMTLYSLHPRAQSAHMLPITSKNSVHVPRRDLRPSARTVNNTSKVKKVMTRVAREKRLDSLGIPQGRLKERLEKAAN